VNKKVWAVFITVFLAGFAGAACSNQETATTDPNVNAEMVSRPGPDNSEITTTTDADGVRTETRVFQDHPRVSRVVVTTRDGRSTVRAYSPSGEEKEVGAVENALDATGDAIADAAGFVADKTEDAAEATESGVEAVGEGARTVGEKTVDGAKTVGDKTVEGAKTVGDKTVEGAKKVGEKTVKGAKKAGSAVKDAITP